MSVQKCCFCEKESSDKDLMIEQLCQSRYYCCFCLRNEYNNYNNRHVLILTFRAIFGYYFWQFYYKSPGPQMWISEIKDFIKSHESIGLQNPIFKYDPETYNWFVDFRRVGDAPKKLQVDFVQKTVKEILACFKLHVHIKLHVNMDDLYIPGKFNQSYEDGILRFYHKRQRLDGKVLSPVLKEYDNFEPPLLVKHLWNKTL